ncbi:unnamed protein product [Trichobilharzia regenti]|nr:unnamed protein product [Trichobilharzia regenti]
MGCLYVYNKIDQISLQEVDRLARQPDSVVVRAYNNLVHYNSGHNASHQIICCNLKLNLDYLLEKLWEYLNLIQVFTKKRGQKPDLNEGIILRNGATVEHIVSLICSTLI